MKRGKLALQIILVFVVTLVGYALVFKWIEHRRVAKGPWIVTFTNEAGHPALEINQVALNLQHVRITFSDAPLGTNAPQTIEFAQARKIPFDLPFGQCVFQDTLFQPGTVAMKIFDHEIQLMPRVLTIDGSEHPWFPIGLIDLRNAVTNVLSP
jgi:hypothetical protein